MTHDEISEVLFLALFGVLALSWLLRLKAALAKSSQGSPWGRRFLWIGLLLSIAALTHRGIYADHAPWSNQYESALFVAFGMALLYAIFERNHQIEVLGLLVLPLVMLVIAAASLLPQEYKIAQPLMPALQSYWLKIHVSLMLLSYGAFATTFGLSLVYLLKSGAWTEQITFRVAPVLGALAVLFMVYVHASTRSPFWNSIMTTYQLTELAGGQYRIYALGTILGVVLGWELALVLSLLPSRILELFPDLDTLDELNYRSVAIGFPMLTLGVILGAFWGHVAWGRYWAWDPKETWAFITWLIFAGFLHMRIFAGWQGRKTAWIGLIGAGSIVFTYWGVNFLLSGLHAYAKGS